MERPVKEATPVISLRCDGDLDQVGSRGSREKAGFFIYCGGRGGRMPHGLNVDWSLLEG